ncbi:MAG: PD40 domain-containing protein [Ardenticatenaceae bacterium]|nr:PD40 domain-containing protein [Ardenticatenaceae bacterium]
MQPFPTVTPDYPFRETKQVFLFYGDVGGDGASPLGSSLPSLVIYGDGQLLMEVGDWQTRTIMESNLSPNEMCDLREQIAATGFMEPHDPFEYFTQQEGSAGAPYTDIQVEDVFYSFYSRDVDYLVADLANGYEIIKNFQPTQPLTLYMPEQFLVSLEEWPYETQTEPIVWPEDLPVLADLRSDPEQELFVIENDLLTSIFDLFSHQISVRFFQENEIVYRMLIRPVLPHETVQKLLDYPFPQAPKDYVPVLNCENEPSFISSAIPTVTPTLTADLAQLSGQGRILFVTDTDGDDEIFVMEADGTNRLRLTNNLADDFSPSSFPDGQHIVFASDRDGDSEIYVMAVDGTDIVQLTNNDVGDYTPAVSPDGMQIAFVSGPDGDWEKSEIYIMRSDGSQLRRLTNDNKGNSNPEWTQDGLHILYRQETGGTLYPYWLDVNTLESISATDTILPSTSGSLRAWSPDNSRFVRDHKVDDTHFAIQIMDVNRNILQEAIMPVDYFRSFDWSSDGKFVLFSAREYGDWDIELYVLIVETGEVIQITHNQQDEFGAVWWP